MKAYERLNVEVVKFEAQDVITASVAAPVKCICSWETGDDHNYYDPTSKMVIEDHTHGNKPCYAEEHDPSCINIM